VEIIDHRTIESLRLEKTSKIIKSNQDGDAELFSLGCSDRMHGNGSGQSCASGGLHWTLGSISLPRGWSNTGTGFLERWMMPQACQC